MAIIEEIEDSEGEEGGRGGAEDDAAQAARRERYELMEAEERDRVAKQFELAEAARVEGNQLLGEADAKGAIASYKRAQRDLEMVGNEDEARRRAEQMNLALSSNLALAHLKLSNFAEAKRHADSALLTDPKSVKALYRRGLAEAGLARTAALFQETEARAGIADFEAVLALDASNAEAKRELQRLKAQLRANERELAQKQKETWGQVFGGRAPDDGGGEDQDSAATALPAVRPCRVGDRHLLLSIEGASAKNKDGHAVLNGIDLELRQSWCVAVCGAGPEARQALTRWICGEAPASGRVVVHPKPKKPGKRNEEVKPMDRRLLAAVGALVVALVVAVELAGPGPGERWLVRFLAALGFVILRFLWSLGAEASLSIHAAVVGPAGAAATLAAPGPSAGLSVEEVLGRELARQLPAGERRERVHAMLAASGLEASGADGLASKRCGDLSEESRRIVHALRCVASRPEVLILDEGLEGLPVDTQARLLRMIKRMQRECKTAILLLTSDLDQASFLADSLAVLSAPGGDDGGRQICEHGPAQEVLETPRSEATQEALASYLARVGRKSVRGEVQTRCQELLADASLGGPWIPPIYT